MAKKVFPGADESTPSRAQFFTWINNTNEGATEAQTRINLEFFQWLHDEYGMILDIYAFDAGAVDGAGFTGSMQSERFKRQFPRGFGPLAKLAKNFSGRLGLWGGPDGFGETKEEETARIETWVSLCRDFNFALFKLDGVCGTLRKEKQDAFVKQMTLCRKYSPDLIMLNHRMDFGKGQPHATTFLFEGAETYIDVHMVNEIAATHNRVCAISRALTPNLVRLTEDHGVCLSSCLDYWEDDLILQAFNRCLILAPEVYGNPWLLRDDEFAKFARIYNLHRRYNQILVKGFVLPEKTYGPHAVSRGEADTRFLTLRNLTWNPVTYKVRLDESIGLKAKGSVDVRRFHPHEKLLGQFKHGETVDIEVLPFRSSLIMAITEGCAEMAVSGCEYEVVCDKIGKPAVLKLLAPPGSKVDVQLKPGNRDFASATLDGKPLAGFAEHKKVRIEFPGKALKLDWHRKLGALKRVPVPQDAQALYEATCFAADNNALEVRELERSGPSKIPQVQAARDAFFNQHVFKRRDLWDRNLFDDDPHTGFAVSRRWPWNVGPIRGGAFRIDFGAAINIDHLKLEVGGDYALQPLKSEEAVRGGVSADLKSWKPILLYAHEDIEGALPTGPIRYVRLNTGPDRVRHICGSHKGKSLDRTKWRASNLFSNYWHTPVTNAFSLKFKLPEAAVGSYLALAIHGEHGHELAYASLRNGQGYVGAPRRAPSFPSNAWECPVRQTKKNYTYYFPITPELIGKSLEAFALILKGGNADVKPELWITAYPVPFAERTIVLDDHPFSP